MPRLYLASNNRHKAEELGAMLAMAGLGWSVHLGKELSPELSWDETGETFLANARIKLQAVRSLTGDAVLADDSGLIVDALGGQPGVHSSRYAGTEGDDLANNAKLLLALKDVPAAKRTARFVCTLCFVDSTGKEQVFTGECHGRIAFAPCGVHGFGYDPLFIVDDMGGRTLAELTDVQKNQVSHRRRAFDKFAAALTVQPSS